MGILESTATESGSDQAVAAPSSLASVLLIDDEEIVGNTLRAVARGSV
jgi:hypothetical protein